MQRTTQGALGTGGQTAVPEAAEAQLSRRLLYGIAVEPIRGDALADGQCHPLRQRAVEIAVIADHDVVQTLLLERFNAKRLCSCSPRATAPRVVRLQVHDGRP